MTVQDNIDLIRSITERGLNHGDVSFVDGVFAANYVVHARDLELPKGPTAFKVAVRFWRRSFPDFHTTIEKMIGEGEYVASRFHTTGTHTGEFDGLPATGKRFSVRGVDMHRVVDGKVVESWISDDMPRILMDIGVLAPAGGPPGRTGPPAPARSTGRSAARAGKQPPRGAATKDTRNGTRTFRGGQ